MMNDEIEKTRRDNTRNMQQLKLDANNMLMADLKKIVGDYAKEKGYTMILDTGVDARLPSSVVFSAENINITKDVLKVLNKNAPKDWQKEQKSEDEKAPAPEGADKKE